ncbi:MAG: DUF1501 domain-containing protein [Glaciecola sp.]
MAKHNQNSGSLLVASSSLSRRQFVKMAGSGIALLSFPISSSLAFEKSATAANNPKIIWLMLRGALDSLHTIVPTFDPQLKHYRPTLSTSFKSALLPLDKGFALHPALSNMHQWYQEKSLLPIVAVSSGYQQRSHFDGQDFLESGKAEIDHDSGWLARALDQRGKRALAISRSIPITLRSSNQVRTWYPSKLKSADTNIYAQLSKLYQSDTLLNESLERGLTVRDLLDKKQSKKRQGKFIDLTKACANLLTNQNENIDCAMLEFGGWDTHSNQSNRLERNLNELDQGLGELKEGLGKEWQNTVIIIGTEFGRTVKENGTGGTDHGTGSALFLAGGAVQGGRVLGDWPGLETSQLFEQRDLMPTSNSYSWISNVLANHWQIPESALQHVFPNITPNSEVLIKKATRR